MNTTDKSFDSSRIPVTELAGGRSHAFVYRASREDGRQLAGEAGVLRVHGLRLQGHIVQHRNGDWHLDARLQARVVQQCISTLKHLTARINSTVQRTYVADARRMACRVDNRIPDDDSLELLGSMIDLFALAREALILELPLYPRASAATAGLADIDSGNTDLETKPLAGLADFYRLLKEDGLGPSSN